MIYGYVVFRFDDMRRMVMVVVVALLMVVGEGTTVEAQWSQGKRGSQG